jgi:alcohol dehydrogenase
VRTTAVVLDALGAERPYTETRPLRVVELELDAPRPTELLVRIAAAGVCHSDLSVVDGSRPRPVPIALGHEAAGVVEEVGAGVLDVRPGDHVLLTFVPSCGCCACCASGKPGLCTPAAAASAGGGMLAGGTRLAEAGRAVHHHLGVSGFATHAVVARGSAVVVPHDVPLATAALFGCAMLTGTGAVIAAAGVRPGEAVAVLGLGGVGLAAVMGAVVAGATPIVGVDPVAEKRALAVELGATVAVHPSDAAAAVEELSPSGVSHAIDTAGSPGAFEAAYALTERGGTTVSVGLPDPAREIRIPAASLVGQARTVVGSYLGSSAPQRDIPRLLALWRGGRLPVERLVTGTHALDEVNHAMEELAAGRAVRQILEPEAA